MAQCIEVITQRLRIKPRTADEMRMLRDREPDAEMKQAYSGMLDIMLACPGKDEWGCDWAIALPDGTTVGGIGFKGAPDSSGFVEIGYGIDVPYRARGYASEALSGMVNWCRAQISVKAVFAQTAPENAESQHILLRCGFTPCGTGKEGPMFRMDV